MLIKDLRKEHKQNRVSVAATVIWEDCDDHDQELRFETDTAFENDLTCDPNAFLIATIMPAFHNNEKRVYIESKVDPEIRVGLKTAMMWIREWWYKSDKLLPRIEDQGDALPANIKGPNRTGMYFSGGVDSLSAIRTNRLTYPMDHPLSVKDGLLVYGLEVENPQIFEMVLSAITAITEDANLNLIPVYTNIRDLNPNWMFWERVFHDAVFGSIAHSFSSRFSRINISATYDVPNLQRAGTHPLLDLCYSTSNLNIHHDGLTMSRLDKIRLISEWDYAFQRIRTCNETEFYKAERLNCGRCRKCITTMLALMALGKLGETRAFPESVITPEFLKSNFEIYKTTVCWWEEAVQPLKDQGQQALAGVIENKLDAFYSRREKNELKQALFSKAKRLDLKYFNGRMNKFRNRLNDKRK